MSRFAVLTLLMFGSITLYGHIEHRTSIPASKSLNVKVFLEGSFNPGTGTMNLGLNTVIPLAQPYNVAPWNYAGSESVASIPADVVDWVLVELRDAISPAAAVLGYNLPGWPKAFFLKSDGSVVNLDGTSMPNIGEQIVMNSLFVIIRHRNHLAILSSAGATLVGDVYRYDFTTDVTQAFGGTAGYKMSGSKAVMATGDIDQDQNIFVSDYNSWAEGFGVTNAYIRSDLDMDHNAFVSDYNKWAANFGSTASIGNGRCTFADSRDGHVYNCVVIGTQTWMAENLAYLPAVNPNSSSSYTLPYIYVYGYVGTSVSEAKASANYGTYGVLYNWLAALIACPPGWHLPSDGEWTVLTDYLTDNGYGYGGSGSQIGKSMAATSGWNFSSFDATIGTNQLSNNSSGFAALPSGSCHSGGFQGLGGFAYFWSASEYGSLANWCRDLSYLEDRVGEGGMDHNQGISVRCLLGESPISPTVTTIAITAITQNAASSGGNIISNGGADISASGVCWSTTASPTTADYKTTDGISTGTFTSSLTGLTAGTPYYVRAYATNSAGTGYGDQKQFTTTEGGVGDGTFTDPRDGHQYKYKTIGTQTWMAENLAYLPAVSPSSDGSDTNPFYYVNGHEDTTEASAKASANFGTYGVLYNWPATATSCPSGWHLPTDAEWKTLEKNQGMSQADADAEGWRNSGTVGGKLKETGTLHWYSPNTGATNSSGFTALPAGCRLSNGGFFGLGGYAFFWSASENGMSDAWLRYLGLDLIGVTRISNNRRFGFSIRCLQNN